MAMAEGREGSEREKRDVNGNKMLHIASASSTKKTSELLADPSATPAEKYMIHDRFTRMKGGLRMRNDTSSTLPLIRD